MPTTCWRSPAIFPDIPGRSACSPAPGMNGACAIRSRFWCISLCSNRPRGQAEIEFWLPAIWAVWIWPWDTSSIEASLFLMEILTPGNGNKYDPDQLRSKIAIIYAFGWFYLSRPCRAFMLLPLPVFPKGLTGPVTTRHQSGLLPVLVLDFLFLSGILSQLASLGTVNLRSLSLYSVAIIMITRRSGLN